MIVKHFIFKYLIMSRAEAYIFPVFNKIKLQVFKSIACTVGRVVIKNIKG